MTHNPLIQNLFNPELYPHPVKDFKLLETHISWIILTGEYAYKIKKPFDFEFLNFSTLEKRKFYCQEEMRLNQLISPELYVDVIEIKGNIEKPNLSGTGEIVDYAIKMREFPQQSLFTELLKDQKITPDIIDQLAKLIAEFHQKTAVATTDTRFGTPKHVNDPVVQNFDQIRPFLTDVRDQEQLAYLQQWSEQQFVLHHELLQQRKDQGFIRDCHGDLHLGNIILYQQKPVLFDRIEFNEDFRWTDVIADIAFIAMDLDDHQQPELARQLLNTYFSTTGDYQGLTLLPFYQAYRAIVRAKVTLFSLGSNTSPEKLAALWETYRRFIALAIHYTQPVQPKLLMTHGLAGSGKSTVARALVAKLGFMQLSSDVERKRLFGLAPNAQTHAGLNSGIYDPEVTDKIYTHLATLAKMILNAGYGVIIDAAFLKTAQRELFADLAKQLQVQIIILDCVAPRAQLEAWVTTRKAAQQDPSEAGLEVLEMQEASAEELTPAERAATITVDTVQLDINKLVKLLQDKN